MKKLEDLASRLRVLRARYGLTQKDVADKLEISQQTYSKYEKEGSVIDSNMITKICELYEITADSLLGLDEKAAESQAEKDMRFDVDNEQLNTMIDFLTKLKR